MELHSSTKEENTFPSGFRHSILSKLEEGKSNYDIGSFIIPKLHDAGLGFKDYTSSSFKPQPVLLQRKINIIAARQISEPTKNFNIDSRFVRMCLHDGSEVVSNIHVVKAKWNQNAPKLWTFNLKLSSKTPCIEDGGIFIRTDKCVPTLGILFELCMKYSSGACTGEMCAGWAFMKLLDDSGAPLSSKTKILKVQDTEPFAPYVSKLSTSGKSGFLKNIMTEQKLSRLVVSVCSPDRSYKQKMSYFPSTLIGPWCCIPIIALCRKVIDDDLMQKYTSGSNVDLIQTPFLASLPLVFGELDLVDVLRISWTSKTKAFNVSEIRRENVKKQAFRDLFMETVFILINSNNLPPYNFGNDSNENDRKLAINHLMNTLTQQGALVPSNGIEYSPLSIEKLCKKFY